MGPEVLSDILSDIKHIPDENLILGFDSSDDAAVYRIIDDLCAIHTLDFFPPIMDDPYEFGAVAAANSLSDIYAMGGTPISALNILCIPGDFDHDQITKRILEGGADKAAEAGINISGGHTLEDHEPKYGLSVVGIARERDIVKNKGAEPGDVLVLTKPLGSGVLTTADKAGMLSPQEHKTLHGILSALNRWPAEQIKGLAVSAGTDITGFGLMGHGAEVADASDVTLHLYARSLPLMDGADELAKDGIIPAGAYKNRGFLKGRYRTDKNVPRHIEDIAFDPQTSGGLLYSLKTAEAVTYLKRCKEVGLNAWIIGEVKEREDVSIRLLFE